ncbi:DUF1772 domain-containing protein [Pseudosulfitobacter pseudonitzschiae]|uniref:anthrone oxygenase family protein n=1 Tax=Pseudosulfitobacter pseudonitzschiae TaxID=1402135 RepID=UPI001AF61E6B|nr:anthrone oxygenase family protein [Pseudosulfitobacter pseudonitzschiae]MBM1816649.1 DUF1772 domain-containing protein [Pseudosulfitobacter pseudonitzschiae]MBM1833247.1 DUF1772 domain-containing protein [Pseudosulfitobacter pseudonitzschiae]MBM1838115.1 DUF1772 domain-containing protein [Pseudosulfitobacter pseudonitzschiae]MBM1843376.1 DUF1772 domain-containing protein [Pseudosulfitobacter pseudonitzschiae]MBM1848242.1 DUF1772 domain-containing protein [Pseudosulfitobacter pseudonitzschia
MPIVFRSFLILSLLEAGAIFGFFYAWVCSTMWGLDAAPPEVAITAMQAMNASVRNGVFAISFFGTPVVLLLTVILAFATGHRRAGVILVAALGFAVASVLATMSVNVPMNEGLAEVKLPLEQADAIWDAYSGPWQLWNTLRTLTSGAALLLVGLAVMQAQTRR